MVPTVEHDPWMTSWLQRLARLKLEGRPPRWRLGSCSTICEEARSLMSRAGVRPDISERVLGHAIPGVEGVYDPTRCGGDLRPPRLADEKAEALKPLAHVVETIVSPPEDNVVEMGRSKRRR